MTTISIIDAATGRVRYAITASGPAAAAQLALVPDDCYVIEADLDPVTQWVESGVVMTRPEAPPEPAAWDWRSKSWQVILPTLDEIDAAARAQRASLLAASDWTQLPDVPIATRDAWAGYRQALRDITRQPGYPGAVDWPVAPSS